MRERPESAARKLFSASFDDQPGNLNGSGSGGRGAASSSAEFRNRTREIDEVADGVAGGHGTRFWLVVAPPQLGKTWFLEQIGQKVSAAVGWAVRSVDARRMDAAIAADADALLSAMFEEDSPGVDPRDPSAFGAAIVSKEQNYLCLLDSAELLSSDTIREFRKRFGEINANVEAAMSKVCRLALVVASRDDDGWRGVLPAPRLEVLKLSEFKVGVILDEIEDLAQKMRREIGRAKQEEYAQLVHGLSEGLPALLAGYIEWIRTAQWVNLDRLANQENFEKLAKAYIVGDLLSASSLLGGGASVADQRQLELLQLATRTFAPYRIVTCSHVSHHASSGALAAALRDCGLSVEHLWAALGRMALLSRPLDEPWIAIHPPIRRLLYRYWYTSDAERAQVHQNACAWLSDFADVAGSDQSMMLVECLWHGALQLKLSDSADPEPRLISLAGKLSGNLRQSSGYSVEDLRRAAVTRINEDYELMKVLEGNGGLIGNLIEAVRRPVLGASS